MQRAGRESALACASQIETETRESGLGLRRVIWLTGRLAAQRCGSKCELILFFFCVFFGCTRMLTL